MEFKNHDLVPEYTAEGVLYETVPVLDPKGETVPEGVIETARDVGSYEDPKLEALRVFTLDLIENRGRISPGDLDAFLAVGFTKQNVLEINVVIAHKVLSNYTNHIVDTPVDDAFSRFTWTKPVPNAA